MMNRLLVLFALSAACGSSEPSEPDRATCERLRDHVVELRMYGEDNPAHRKALNQALGEDFVTECRKNTSRAEIACAMAATDLEKLRSCAQRR